ncbi:hypothetical protein LTR14_000580, partial [Exophiala xenobiotica]
CERCRKRKIKCSGNEGDNQSCANCRNAGHGDSCRFLRVASMDAGSFGFRGWHSPHRYSPYSLPSNHRLNYVPLSSRYNPQNSVQYPAVHPGIDYAGYATPSPSVDWARTSYVGSYSPYPDDEETSPYSAHPPPYILPNTDPMSTANGYYVHAQNVRPHPGALWTEQQHCISQQGSHLPTSAYSIVAEPPQSYHATGVAGNLPSDRILPTPVTARSISSTQPSSLDCIPNSVSTPRSSAYWPSDSATSAQHVPAQVDSNAGQEQSDERRCAAYSIQDMTYNHLTMGDGLPTTSVPAGLRLNVDEAHASPATVHTGGGNTQAQHCDSRKSSHESPQANQDNTSIAYGYTGLMTGRSSQMRSTSGQLSKGSSYCRTQPMVTRREPVPEECSPDCSGCPTDSSRGSVVSISNTSSGY